MAKKLLFVPVGLLIFSLTACPGVSYAQQPTFGPTCSPTPMVATSAPPPTARPTLLRTGITESTITLLGMGGFMIFFGAIALSSLLFQKD